MNKVLIFAIPTPKAITALKLQGKICGGGWVESLIDSLIETKYNVSLCFFYECKSILHANYENIDYYALPTYNFAAKSIPNRIKKSIDEIIHLVNPDFIHIIGTERIHVKYILQHFDPKKILLSITGMPSIIAPLYYAGLSESVIARNKTIGDILRHRGIKKQKRDFEIMGKAEEAALKLSHYVMGRTEWDYVSTKSINPNIHYFFGNESLRRNFYSNIGSWSISTCIKHSIFLSQASYPLKGLHQLLYAVKIIKPKYPDIKIIISGPNILDHDTLIQKLKFTNYGKIIYKLCKQYDLLSHIEFIGNIGETEIIEQYKRANLVVVPSIIENKSNTIGEAMMIGTPVIAAYVGGMTEMINYGENGFFYPYNEPNRLAFLIHQIFSDESLQIKFSKNGIQSASKMFNREEMKNNILKAYEVIENGK